ncbi:MAG: hypothetical protein FWC50_02795 [Planctomycetaceae bacterium]|nr:hypothetical protein [Planctomycetaceae bacterium]
MTKVVQCLVVKAESEKGEQLFGTDKNRMIKDRKQIEQIFGILEHYKGDVEKSGFDFFSHDYVIIWKINGDDKMDNSRIFLRLDQPKTFQYLSDVGNGVEQKYTFKLKAEDARILWQIVGVDPPFLEK